MSAQIFREPEEPLRGFEDGSGQSAEKEAARVYSVSQLTRRITSLLDGLGRVSVEGEVSRISRAASGHLYFDLKDLDARLSCIVWKSQVPLAVRFDLREGMQVVARGKLDIYPPRGAYSLIVQRLEPAGIGALLAELEELKARLKAKGWFDRRRALPSFPRVVGVATSRDGAALQDILRTRSLRWPLYPLRIAHTPVQGTGAAESIARAIRDLDASGVSVIVVARGGGSLEDLWAFNELPVAEAIWNSRAPVVTGVGHQTDFTLADFVADHRAHTPTDAAQAVIPDRGLLVERLDRAHHHLARAIDAVADARAQALVRYSSALSARRPARILAERARVLEQITRRISSASHRALSGAIALLHRSAHRLASSSPAVIVERSSARIQAAGMRLSAGWETSIAERGRRVALAARALEGISPERVLERGYTITVRSGSNAPLRSSEGLRAGEEIETRLSRGRVFSSVSRAEPRDDALPRQPVRGS